MPTHTTIAPEPVDYVETRSGAGVGDRAIIILRAIVTLGVPSCIALFLVWQISVAQTKQIEGIATEVSTHSVEVRHDMNALLLATQSLQTEVQREQVILRAICVNLSKTNEQQSRCFDFTGK